jgi:hypothetical protein
MLDAVHRFASVEQKMANYTPRGRNIELFKQSEQTINYNLPFNHARSSESLRAK